MKIIEPSVELMTPFDGEEVLKLIEKCGRTCYHSEGKITEDSASKFVKMLIQRGHESVLEHFSCTFKIICDRGVMAQMTRHRLASYSVESTRYCDYSDEKFGGELAVISPQFQIFGLPRFLFGTSWFKAAIEKSEDVYKRMIKEGIPPEDARSVLPMSLATTMTMTANLREWRHILKLRASLRAHPRTRQIAYMILAIFKEKIPAVFEDIGKYDNA